MSRPAPTWPDAAVAVHDSAIIRVPVRHAQLFVLEQARHGQLFVPELAANAAQSSPSVGITEPAQVSPATVIMPRQARSASRIVDAAQDLRRAPNSILTHSVPTQLAM